MFLETQYDQALDASGLACPLPLLKAKQAISAMRAGEILSVIATDPGSARDIPAWCVLAGHTMLKRAQVEQKFYFLIKKKF